MKMRVARDRAVGETAEQREARFDALRARQKQRAAAAAGEMTAIVETTEPRARGLVQAAEAAARQNHRRWRGASVGAGGTGKRLRS